VSTGVALRRLPPLTMLMTVALVAACGTSGPSPTTSASPGSPSPSPAASPTAAPRAAALILRVTSEGGFIGPAANLAALPEVSVYADGRILTPGAVDAVYPVPLLTPVQVKDVGPAGAAAIIAAIRAAGLDKASAGGGAGNPDTGTQVFAVSLDGTTVTTRVGLGGGPGVPGHPGGAGSPDPLAGAAADLLARLQDPAETWGATPVMSVLTPTGYRIYSAPGAPPSDGTSGVPAVPWPLSTPLEQFGVPANPDRGIPGLRQGAVFGSDATSLTQVLSTARLSTPFSSGGKVYTLYVRALLPDEVPAPG
jgi:hypothetical protein